MDLPRRFAFSTGIAALAAGLVLVLTTALATGQTEARRAIVLELEGAIGPASSDFIVRGIEEAGTAGVALVILRMNTPGGLDTSMREIISAILASSVPIVAYVSPPGSRAASAGTYIMYASHAAAMAPATNLGSATPVSMTPGGLGEQKEPAEGKKSSKTEEPDDETAEGTESESESTEPGSALQRKVINDAVAYIKGLARLRGRNEEWAVEAVRSAVNLTAEDALEQNVIDLVARDIPDLLQQLDGRSVNLQSGALQLDTGDLVVETVEPDWRTRLLAVITNPNVAYILIILGVYGLFFELSNPGAMFPGVLGAICLLLALYAFHVLPVNYAGLALILLGIAFMVGELFVPSFGVLGIGGAAAFIIGSLILIETEIEAFQLSIPLIVTVTALTAVFVFALISIALRQRKKPVVSGREQMLGSVGEALEDFEGTGNVHIHGELWSARTERPVREGQRVKVRELDGLTLIVEPVEEK